MNITAKSLDSKRKKVENGRQERLKNAKIDELGRESKGGRFAGYKKIILNSE